MIGHLLAIFVEDLEVGPHDREYIFHDSVAVLDVARRPSELSHPLNEVRVIGPRPRPVLVTVDHPQGRLGSEEINYLIVMGFGALSH